MFKICAEKTGGAAMITYETIVQQIAKLATEVSHTKNEQLIREQLTAIRALCDVVLEEKTTVTKASSSTNVTSNFVNPSISSPVFAQPVMMPSQKLEEEDANGDSIFDF